VDGGGAAAALAGARAGALDSPPCHPLFDAIPSGGGAGCSEAADPDAGAGGFDTGGVAEPQRQVSQPAAAPQAAPPATSEGPWNVQVFAGRDRQAAERIVDTLRAQGWPVRLQSLPEGAGSLLKVRVGGYATRAAADEAAGKLRGQGQTGAWVTDTP
jgi:cell division septation protein DedD